jgi:hypothetical protein
MAREHELSDIVLAMPGMSGRCYRMFINNLVRLVSKPRYLEVGSWAGSTVCAAMQHNVMRALCIDNWSLFGGPKDMFFHHIGIVRSDTIKFDFIESDFRQVDVKNIGRFNIYLFDGPHEEKDQYDGLAMYEAALDDDFFFIVDDWNWEQVRRGTLSAIRDAGYDIDFAIEIRTTHDNTHAELREQHSDWHNGCFLSKLSRRQKRYD